MLYDYLFFKGYQLGKRSGNFEDVPVLAGVVWVGGCFMFNLFTLDLALQAVDIIDSSIFKPNYKYIFCLLLVSILAFYYSFGGRYKRIIARFEVRESKTGKSLSPIIVIVSYVLVSFILGTLAAMFKNGDGIF